MKEIKKKAEKKQSGGKIPEGLLEFLAALGVIVLVVAVIFATRSCTIGDGEGSGDNETDSSAAEKYPTTTVLNTIAASESLYPIKVSESITLDKVYTATGYFPEDGTDEAVENVLAVKLTNTSEKTLEYLTFKLNVNGEFYKFAATTVPAGKSVYVFNADRKSAPAEVQYAISEVEYEIYFAEEPTTNPESFLYKIENGTIVVKNISDSDIRSDIVVYYKSTAENGYLGGITYRFRISGGLAAGKTYNGYAPHAYSHMTEIMFTQYEE